MPSLYTQQAHILSSSSGAELDQFFISIKKLEVLLPLQITPVLLDKQYFRRLSLSEKQYVDMSVSIKFTQYRY